LTIEGIHALHPAYTAQVCAARETCLLITSWSASTLSPRDPAVSLIVFWYEVVSLTVLGWAQIDAASKFNIFISPMTTIQVTSPHRRT